VLILESVQSTSSGLQYAFSYPQRASTLLLRELRTPELTSYSFHTTMNHSPNMDKLGMQLDFQGVILLMWGATVPLIYYGFYCDKSLQWAYWSLVWAIQHFIHYWKLDLQISIQLSAFAIACSIVTFQPRFSDPFLRPIRAVTFGSLAFSSIIPVIHGIIKYGWDLQSQRMGLKWVLVTLGLNTLGAAAYAIKVSSFKLQAFTCLL
jgi:adiponectin receptor